MIPLWSLILYTTVTLIVSLSGTFIYALAINVISKLLIFALISAAVIRFRKTEQSPEAVFRIRYPKLSAITGILLCIVLLAGAESSNLIHVAIAIGTGILLYFLHFLFKRKKTGEKTKDTSPVHEEMEI